jgi:hypothetical protein
LPLFTEHLGTKFQAYADDSAAVELEMTGATDTGSGPGQEQFSIVFRGPLDALLTQRTYRMEHPRMGTFDLFLVPIKREQDGFYYEACFARMT